MRLWSTTPAVLRDTTAETSWSGGTLPAGTGLLIFAPFFHRDDRRLACADSFAPGLWLDGGEPAGEAALIPFSAGPGQCPGRDVVLLLTSALVATVLREGAPRAAPESALDRHARLPATLSPYRLSFDVAAVGRG